MIFKHSEPRTRIDMSSTDVGNSALIFTNDFTHITDHVDILANQQPLTLLTATNDDTSHHKQYPTATDDSPQPQSSHLQFSQICRRLDVVILDYCARQILPTSRRQNTIVIMTYFLIKFVGTRRLAESGTHLIFDISKLPWRNRLRPRQRSQQLAPFVDITDSDTQNAQITRIDTRRP